MKYSYEPVDNMIADMIDEAREIGVFKERNHSQGDLMFFIPDLNRKRWFYSRIILQDNIAWFQWWEDGVMNPVDFGRVFEESSPEIQEKFVWHLDLFTKKHTAEIKELS